MRLGKVIERLRDAGGVLTIDDEGRVHCAGNADVMTDAVVAALEARHDQVRAYLYEERAATLAGTTTRSHGWCVRCGRVVWVGTGAERLPGGELVCGDCLAPWDIEAGSVPVEEPECPGVVRSDPGGPVSPMGPRRAGGVPGVPEAARCR